MEQAVVKSANLLAEQRTALAVFRTMLAASRSLMAWVRTGLSMMGFGFTLYKFLSGIGDAIRPNAPRNAGLFLIGLGIVSVLFGWIEYWQTNREIRHSHNQDMRRFPLLMAAFVGLLGVVLFLTVLLHVA